MIDPPLLQGGRCTQPSTTPTLSEDWWVECAEIELQSTPMLQVAVGVQVPNVSEGPVADLVEGGGYLRAAKVLRPGGLGVCRLLE